MSKRRLLAIAVAGAMCLTASTASAGVAVKGIDSGSFPLVRVSVVTSEPSASHPGLRENGQPVWIARAENLGRAKSVVLAIDRSQSMRGGPLAHAVAAARSFLASKPADDRLAVATFATKPQMLTEFSTKGADSDGALRSIEVDPVQGTTLYDEIVQASNTLSEEPLEARVIIVVTDGNETRSSASLTQAIAAARKARAAIYVVAIESPKFNPEPLRRLAQDTGGAYHGTASGATLGSEYAAIASELKRTWRLEYATATRPGDHAELEAVWNGQKSSPIQFSPPTSLGLGSNDAKPSGLLPDVFYETVLGTQVMAIVSFFIVLIGASLALTTVKGSRLKKKIAPHLATSIDARKRKQHERERLQAAAGLFRATENALENWKFWKRLERLVERSDMPLRTVELVYMMVGIGLFLATLATLSGQPTVVTLGLLAGGAMAPVGVVAIKAARRLKAFENQLPDVLITLAAALKAGHSFKQGLQTIVDEGNPPASKEFNRVLTEARLGRPVELALADMSERLGSKNFDFVITAVKIQQQVGGSLAGLIDMVADTVRQRQQFIRKVKGLTAMGRAGAYVLVGLPFFIAGAITVVNPTYMTPLYHTSTGHMLIYTGLAMMAFGSLLLKKIVSFKG
ncbi:MAG TPA: type II secretion system F family protein [Gaiellaceae bacterium]|jgi:tight adherence protein B